MSAVKVKFHRRRRAAKALIMAMKNTATRACRNMAAVRRGVDALDDEIRAAG